LAFGIFIRIPLASYSDLIFFCVLQSYYSLSLNPFQIVHFEVAVVVAVVVAAVVLVVAVVVVLGLWAQAVPVLVIAQAGCLTCKTFLSLYSLNSCNLFASTLTHVTVAMYRGNNRCYLFEEHLLINCVLQQIVTVCIRYVCILNDY